VDGLSASKSTLAGKRAVTAERRTNILIPYLYRVYFSTFVTFAHRGLEFISALQFADSNYVSLSNFFLLTLSGALIP
jgi:hypothetical protein